MALLIKQISWPLKKYKYWCGEYSLVLKSLTQLTTKASFTINT